ncbi:MAG: DUF4198 domain-containing protein [Pseudomonadota bacterium]
MMRSWLKSATLHRLLLAVSVALSAQAARAHDFWIVPTSFFPQPGQTLGVALRVGEQLVGDPVPRDPVFIKAFIVAHAAGRQEIVGRAGMDPAGALRVAAPGLHVVGFHSQPIPIELPPEKFNQYLKEEGLDAIADLRRRRGQADASAREIFSRCAKSLMLVGAPSEEAQDQVLGFTLELVAERNPYALGSGQMLPLRLLYQGRPLEGVLIVAMNQMNAAEKLIARSDKHGRVQFSLRPGGMWLIKAVHMVEAPPDTHAQWASYWASLTFDMRAKNSDETKKSESENLPRG